MPLTRKGQKIMSAMEGTYGPEKAERVFYASRNAGKITGVDKAKKRAVGGRVSPRHSPYLVGEEGPELFVPERTGTIKNARQTARMRKKPNSRSLRNGQISDRARERMRMNQPPVAPPSPTGQLGVEDEDRIDGTSA